MEITFTFNIIYLIIINYNASVYNLIFSFGCLTTDRQNFRKFSNQTFQVSKSQLQPTISQNPLSHWLKDALRADSYPSYCQSGVWVTK